MKGSVKFFNSEKGWGFIVPDEGDKDIFVHQANIEGDIQEGDNVTYEVEDSERGPKAVNVKIVD